MSEPSSAQKKQKEKRDNNLHEAKKGKLNVSDERLVYVKKQLVAIEEGKDAKKEEEKKKPPEEKNVEKILPHNAEIHGLPPSCQDVDMKEETLTDPHIEKKNTPVPRKGRQLPQYRPKQDDSKSQKAQGTKLKLSNSKNKES